MPLGDDNAPQFELVDEEPKTAADGRERAPEDEEDDEDVREATIDGE